MQILEKNSVLTNISKSTVVEKSLLLKVIDIMVFVWMSLNKLAFL